MTPSNPSEINPAIVARIRKLMNLASNGAASESEQEQASAHAQRLMLEHNITLATVEMSQDTSTVVKRAKEQSQGGARFKWQRMLMNAVATSNFCLVVSDKKYKIAGGARRSGHYRQHTVGYTLVGREENVAAALLMFDYLRTTVDRLGHEYVGGGRRMMSNEAISFKEGCAARIQSRIFARHREALAAQRASAEQLRTSDSNALVPIMEDYVEMERCANEDFRLGLPQGTTAHRKFVAARKTDAWNIASEVLNKKDLKNVDDRATLEQLVTEEISSKLAAAGLTEKEFEEVAAYGRDWQVEHHIARAHGKVKKERRTRNYRTRSAKPDRTNYTAYTAGSEAGSRVSLDKQVGKSSQKQIG